MGKNRSFGNTITRAGGNPPGAARREDDMAKRRHYQRVRSREGKVHDLLLPSILATSIGAKSSTAGQGPLFRGEQQ